jgi:4-methylaminobutanoate oxidase (formaldehyde-forming)
MVNASIPLHAAEHMHMVTKPIEGVYRGMPVLRDMDGYVYFKEETGGIECDLTITRLEENTYFIVTPGATSTRDNDWIQRHLSPNAHVSFVDVTSSYTMLAVMGPKSRKLLCTLTNADLSNESFPFATAQQIDVAYAKPIAIRMSFVGELGWELYIPTEFSVNVFDALMDEGEKLDMKLTGLHALDSLRLEKGYVHWGADITPDDTPYEAGLGFCVKLDKGDFIGRKALIKQKKEGLKRRRIVFTVEDPEPLLYHDEPIYRNGKFASQNTHGAYAHYLGSAIGMCYIEKPDGIDDEWLLAGNYEIKVEGKLYPIKIHINAPYDPGRKRVRL